MLLFKRLTFPNIVESWCTTFKLIIKFQVAVSKGKPQKYLLALQPGDQIYRNDANVKLLLNLTGQYNSFSQRRMIRYWKLSVMSSNTEGKNPGIWQIPTFVESFIHYFLPQKIKKKFQFRIKCISQNFEIVVKYI